MDSKDYTTYLSTIKDVLVRLILLIFVKNGLGLMVGYIGNALLLMKHNHARVAVLLLTHYRSN